jgi:hypothetical protein
MCQKPTATEDMETSKTLVRLANNPALHRALNTSPEVLAHYVPLEMEGTNDEDEDDFWYTENFPK